MPKIRKNSITYNPLTKTFTQLEPVERQPLLELSEEARVRVIKDFREIFNREPDQEEVDELYREEFENIYGRKPNKIEVERMNSKGGKTM